MGLWKINVLEKTEKGRGNKKNIQLLLNVLDFGGISNVIVIDILSTLFILGKWKK